MKIKELEKQKGRSSIQLRKEVEELKDKLWDAQQQIQKGKEKNVRKSSAIKKSIAQIKTLLAHKLKEEQLANSKENK